MLVTSTTDDMKKKSIFIECKMLYMSPTWIFIQVYGCVWLSLSFKVRNIHNEALSKVTQWVDENKPECYITEFILLHIEIWLVNIVVNLLFMQQCTITKENGKIHMGLCLPLFNKNMNKTYFCENKGIWICNSNGSCFIFSYIIHDIIQPYI